MNFISIINVILFVGAAQGSFLALVLLSVPRGNKSANRILAVLLFLFSLMIFFHTIGEIHGSIHKDQDTFITHCIFFLFGPLFYFYVRALTKNLKFKINDLLHFLPFIVSTTFFLILYRIQIKPYSFHADDILPWLMMLQMASYLFYVVFMLWEYSSLIHQSYSSIEKINLNWLQFLTIGQLIIWPIAFFVELYLATSEAWNFIWILISLFMYIMGYKTFRQPEIILGTEISGILNSSANIKKYKKSTLSSENADKYYKNLQDFVEKKKPYLENDLTLPDLASRLNISVHHLSQVLNERMQQNFFDYINSYRVEEAKRLLIDPARQNFTIAAIGFEAGFNSVTTFNSIFKKKTRMTPSQYKTMLTK